MLNLFNPFSYLFPCITSPAKSYFLSELLCHLCAVALFEL